MTTTPMASTAIAIAQQMIGTDRVDARLEKMLRNAEVRIRLVKPDGSLRSTQVISSIIAIWEATGGAK